MSISGVGSDLALSGAEGLFLLTYCLSFLAVLFPGKDYRHLSDNELIARCSRKSRHWNKIWQEFEYRFGGLILNFIYSELKNIPSSKFTNEGAKDLRQDVYIKLLRNNARALKDFHGKNQSSFAAYLYIISRNLVKNFAKGKHGSVVSMSGGLQDESLLSRSTETAEQLDLAFFKDFIIKKIRTCHQSRNQERDILIFELYYFEDQSAIQVAKHPNVDLSASGVETVVSRITGRLQQTLKI